MRAAEVKPYRVCFGSGPARAISLSVSLEPPARDQAFALLDGLGARYQPVAAEAKPGPSLSIGRMDDAVTARELCDLVPGDAVWCLRESQVGQYCSDGVVEYRENDTHTRVTLIPRIRPNLAGALGLGLVRALSSAGVLVLHAAALHLHGLTLLVLGPSGAGKSTLCAAVLRAGGRVVTDDLVLLAHHGGAAATQGEIALYPYRADILLRTDGRALLPERLAQALRPESRLSGPKLRLGRLALPEGFSGREILSCLAVLGTGPRPRQSQLQALDQSRALIGVLSGLLYRLSPVAREPMLQAAKHVVGGCPAVQLDVGTRLMSAPEAELAHIHNTLMRAIQQG